MNYFEENSDNKLGIIFLQKKNNEYE